MVHEYTRDRLQGWVADYCEGDGLLDLPTGVPEHASALLSAWLIAACDRRDVEPEDLELADLRDALLEHVALLTFPAHVHEAVPVLCRDFLARLEAEGRLSDGRDLGMSLYAQGEAYARAVSGRPEPIKRPGSKLGRNDPCPCGSGKKYKRCCMKS